MKIGKSIIKGGFKRKVFLIFIMVAIIISQPLNLVQAWELPDGQEPFNIVEIKPEIKPGQGLVKINFRLPQGSFITDDFVNFFVLCDYVNSKGEEKMNTKNLYMKIFTFIYSIHAHRYYRRECKLQVLLYSARQSRLFKRISV